MNRIIRRDTKGIALIDSSGDTPRMKYVFDVSDTDGGANACRPFLWEYCPEHWDCVTATPEQRFDQSGCISLAFQLEAIAGELIESYWEEHQRVNLCIVDGSLLKKRASAPWMQNKSKQSRKRRAHSKRPPLSLFVLGMAEF